MTNMRKIIINMLLWTTLLTVIICSCSEPPKKYIIGVAQCSDNLWRQKLNHELVVGSYIRDDIRLEIVSADDHDELQIHQIQEFIDQKIDLLIVAPNSADKQTAIIDKAYDSGIPVIVFDRHTNSKKFTAFVGANNYEIGRMMAKKIAGDIQCKGVVAEISGRLESSAGIERHQGFMDRMGEYPEISVISSEQSAWSRENGAAAIQQLLEQYGKKIDCVFGHDDRMAIGAKKMAVKMGYGHVKCYGVDALPNPHCGIQAVQAGILEATCIYPTRGVELIHLAMKILEGKKVEKMNILTSTVVDRNNASILMAQHAEQQRIGENLEIVKRRMDNYFSTVHTQRRIIVVFVVTLLVFISLSIIISRLYLTRISLRQEITDEMTTPAPLNEDKLLAPRTIIDTESKTDNEQGKTFLNRFREILRDNMADANYGVERLGTEMGMSRAQLYRKVKNLTGMTPIELMRKTRLAKGKQLLNSTDMTIAEIAYNVGFTSPSYFAKCFKEEFGRTPGDERNRSNI